MLKHETKIELDHDQWLALSPQGMPLNPPDHWLVVFCQIRNLKEQGIHGKSMHNRVRLILSAKQTLGMQGIPDHLVIPTCPLCSDSMQLRFGEFGSFISCVKYPKCSGKVSCIDCICSIPHD